MQKIIDELRAYALANYDDPKIGWDYLVEAYDDKEIEEELVQRQIRTAKQAIERFKILLRPLRSRDNEMRAMRDW